MYERSAKFNSQSGFSLVETLVVIVIIAIVATLAVLNRGVGNNTFQRQNAARELKVLFERARFDSVKRRADGAEPYAYVQVRSDGFTLRTYTRQANAALTPNDLVKTVPAGIQISHYSSGTLPMTVTFNRRGETAGGVPQFRVTDQRTGSSEILLITATGTVNLLPGTASIPTFSDPTLSGNPADGETINPHVVVP
jgi:prepilin-type N-terminal cleavage/methylation domain-containing protein